MKVFSKCLFASLFICTLGSGIVPPTILSSLILFILILLVFTEEIYYTLPFMIFYYSVYGILFGVSVFRIFTLLIFGKFILNSKSKIYKSPKIIPVLIYVTYSITIFASINLKTALFNLVTIFSVLIIISKAFNEISCAKKFFSIYSIVALFSYITGLVQGNTLSYTEMMVGGYTEMSRFMATFEDPNYMGFFFMIAIFATVVLKLYSKVVRILIVIALSIILFTSLSMTAVVGYLLLWVSYLTLGKKINIKSGLALIGLIVAMVILFNSSVLQSIPLMDVFINRIKYKLLAFRSGDMVTVTSNRANRFQEHLIYYNNETILRKLFGGNFVTPFGSNLRNMDKAMAHNEYIDLLLNVGIIGEAILLGYLFWSLYKYFRNYCQYGADLDLFKVMMKLIWIYYAFTLTTFMDFRFMIPYLL